MMLWKPLVFKKIEGALKMKKKKIELKPETSTYTLEYKMSHLKKLKKRISSKIFF